MKADRYDGIVSCWPALFEAILGAETSSRVHTVVADPAQLNFIDSFRSRMPFLQSVCERLPESPAWAVWLLGVILGNIAGGQSLAGWPSGEACSCMFAILPSST